MKNRPATTPMRRTFARLARLASLALLALPPAALAYIGPTATVGTLFMAAGIILAVTLLLVGFLWYPVKQLVTKLRGGNRASGGKTPDAKG